MISVLGEMMIYLSFSTVGFALGYIYKAARQLQKNPRKERFPG